MARQWQCRENTGQQLRRRLSVVALDRLPSLAVAARRTMLGRDTPHLSFPGKQGARAYAPSISTGALPILRA